MKLRIDKIDRFGDLQFNISKELMDQNGFSYGDILTIRHNNSSKQMPYCRYITDVLPGQSVLCFEANMLSICILNGNYASEYGIAEYHINEKQETEWSISNDDYIEIELYEKQGYADTLKYFNFTRSNNREDYESDEVFANFREVIPNALYRSSSPVNTIINRSDTADKLIGKYNIKTIINLCDSDIKIEKMLKSNTNYERIYKDNRVLALNMNSDFKSKIFQMQIASAFKEILKYEKPFLIHCTDGKDRTGFVILIIMALCGYSKEEIIHEYLKTYCNYYHISKNDEKYEYLKENALKYFFDCLKVKNDIRDAVISYLIQGKMSEDDIQKLINLFM